MRSTRPVARRRGAAVWRSDGRVARSVPAPCSAGRAVLVALTGGPSWTRRRRAAAPSPPGRRAADRRRPRAAAGLRRPVPVFTHPDCLRHDPGAGPSRDARAAPRAARRARASSPASSPRGPAGSTDALARRAPARLPRLPRGLSAAGGGALFLDTVMNAASWDAALGATGAVLAAVDHAHARRRPRLRRRAAARPPRAGRPRRWASASSNNAVVAARHAQRAGARAGADRRLGRAPRQRHPGAGGARRQRSASSRCTSRPWYPGTGAADERGVGQRVQRAARAAGCRPTRYVEDSGPAIVAATDGLDARLVLVSAGFDAMAGDPLGGFTLEPEHYAELTRAAARAAARRADRRRCSRAATCPRRLADGRAGARRAALGLVYDPALLPSRSTEDPVTQPLRLQAEYPRAPHQAPVHHRPGRAERLPDRLGAADRRATAYEGWGEAAPTQVLRRDAPRRCMAALDVYARRLPADPFDLEETERRWRRCCAATPSARAALSAALHDLVGKRLGVPVYRLWGLDPAKAPMSTFTIGIDTPERIRLKVRRGRASTRSSRSSWAPTATSRSCGPSATPPTRSSGWTPTAAGP